MLKVLHVASFSGNIGDNANHNGLRRKIAKICKSNIVYTEIEVRRFYQNYNRPDKLKFDDNFVEIANAHDLVIIGGGNFFEIWIESSSTGTTIDMPGKIIEKIKTPIFFFGLGFDPYKGVPEGNIDKFKSFIDKLIEKKIHTITVRNDGSMKHIENLLGTEYKKKIEHVPDGGFFIELEEANEKIFNISSPYIAINVAKDMADLRFNNGENSITYELFTKTFAKTLDIFLEKQTDFEIIFIPHIYSDLDAIYDILKNMSDPNRRHKVSTAPLLHGLGSEQIVFNIYKNAKFSMGTRFHTNVCSIGLNTPSIGLVSYPKLKDLYEELNLLNRIVEINQYGFQKTLLTKMEETLKNKKSIKLEYSSLKKELENEMDEVILKVFS